jgi:hypothetical protein
MMKTKPKPICLCLLAAGTLLSATVSLRAQTFAYTNGDLVAAFRIAGGANDLVVDLGPVSKFESLPARSVTTITNLAATQLADALPTLNGVSWSVSAALRANPNYPQYGIETIWITAPRPDIYTPGNVWQRAAEGTLGGAASQIDAIGVNAATYGNGQPAGTDNTPTNIVIPSASFFSYTYQVGPYGNLSGTFQGNPENTTPTDFDLAGRPSRSVLYRLEPDFYPHATGVVVGFFDFKPDGTLTFTAGPPPERTIISNISYQGHVATISFATVNLVGYRLRYTDSAGLTTPISTWNLGSALIGDGTTLFLQDTSSTTDRFYTIEAYY